MSYKIETKLAPRGVYFTPRQSNAYYATRYARKGITVHWWGDNTGASNHNNIVNYFMRRKDGSVNYIVSDKKITMMVHPNNVAWTSQAGNPTTISIEFQPTLSAEGYKRGGWLINELEKKYKKTLKLYKHSDWTSTACPGTISLKRLRAEANKFKNAKTVTNKRFYVVRNGDYLNKIARMFKTTVGRIMKLNPKVKNPNRIKAKDKLRVK